jgi:hypothetical protein
MASCSSCGRDVGCGCNLSNGLCLTCLAKDRVDDGTPLKKSTKRIVYNNTVEPLPKTEFESILSIKGISREEKLRRINEILEKAKTS